MRLLMTMRTTVNIDDDLLDAAADFLGIDERSKLVNAVFAKFVTMESAKRLARLGGTMPDLVAPDVRSSDYPNDPPSGMSIVAEDPS